MSAKIPPKPAKDTIYVDVDDEITSIIDKVENSGHKVVALVLPKRAATLQSIVNMKLLKRSADSADKNVVLITSEHALLPLAGAAGLHVARNLQSKPEIPDSPPGVTTGAAKGAAAEETAELPAESEDDQEDLPAKFDYAKPIGALAAKHEAENPETINLDDGDEDKPLKAASKVPKGAKVKVPNFDRFRMLLGLGGLALIALIVFIILAFTVLPKAKITVHTSSEPVTANFNLNASSSATLDPVKGTIPSKLETSDQTGSQQVTATGQQNQGNKATGSATLTNCGANAATVPAGSGVSQNGLTYLTQSSVSLDSGNFDSHGNCKSSGSHVGSTNMVAQQAGSKYNTSLSGASVSGFSGVTASGSTSGGSDNIVTVLSQGDVDNAKNKLTSGSTGSDFVKAFENKLAGQGEYVLASTLKTGDPNITASPSVGQPASTANVTIKITYTALTVKKDDLSQDIQTKLNDQIDEKKQKLSDNFFADANITVQSQSSPTTAVLLINEDTTAVPIIDKPTFQKLAAGKKAGDIKSALEAWPGVKKVDVNLSPFWVSKAPKAGKITIFLQAEKSSSSKSAP
jgi:hypothetical protein